MLATSDVHFLLEALEVHIAGLCEADESKENAESLSKAESIKEVLEESIEKL